MRWLKRVITSIDNGLEYQIYKFTPQMDTRTITELCLNGYKGQHYQISVKTAGDYSHQNLKIMLKQAGFLLSDVDSQKIILSSSCPSFLHCFLQTLNEAEPSLKDILISLYPEMNLPSFLEPTVLPAWNRIGLFTQHFTPYNTTPNSINRRVIYQSMKPQSIISEFSLYRMISGSYQFEFKLVTLPAVSFLSFYTSDKALNDRIIALNTAIHHSSLRVQKNNHADSFYLNFSQETTEDFDQLINLLAQHCPHFSIITNSFMDHVKPIFSVSHHQKLMELGVFEKELSKEDRQRYEQYCCTLSYEIMTDPVYDPRAPEQFQFDESWITEALKKTPIHPYTRQPLTVQQLHRNTPLKKEIDDFVKYLIDVYTTSYDEPTNTYSTNIH